MVKKQPVIFLISVILLIFTFFLSLALGTEKINLFKVLSNPTDFSFEQIILFQLRLPRSILVLLSGILLAGSGAIFQLFFRNPLAEPGLMGISSGATLGAVICQSAGFGIASAFISSINIFAFLGAIISGLIVTILAAGSSSKESSVLLILCGTALGTLYSAVSSIILLTSNKELFNIYAWTLGSFSGHGWKELCFILIPSVISIIMMFILCPMLDLLSGGEQSALVLGLNVKIIRILVIITGALAASASVCAGGTISFVGLIAPHIVRKIAGPKGKILVPLSMIFGAILLLAADTLSRIVIAPSELPAGIITALLGVPFFISIILQKRRS